MQSIYDYNYTINNAANNKFEILIKLNYAKNISIFNNGTKIEVQFELPDAYKYDSNLQIQLQNLNTTLLDYYSYSDAEKSHMQLLGSTNTAIASAI